MESPEQNKVFVGGISWETTEEILRGHFAKYGTVLGSVIAKDRVSGSPRGFAFIRFSESAAVHRALQDSHEILGRTVEVKKAVTKSSQQSANHHDKGLNGSTRSNCRSGDHFRTKKIFVGGLSANLTEEEFRTYFEKFGRITDVVVMHDNVTHRPRGFGFITFDAEDSVEEALLNNFHQLSGKLVEVKRAVPKDESSSNSNGCNGTMYGGRGPNNNWCFPGVYPPYDFRFQCSPSWYGNAAGYQYGAGMFGGGYPPGGYSGMGYGFPPVAAWGPWGHAMVGFRPGVFPYGSGAPVYPMDLNGWAGMRYVSTNGCDESFDSEVRQKSIQSAQGTEGAGESMGSHIVNNSIDADCLRSVGTLGSADKQSQNNTDQPSPENSI